MMNRHPKLADPAAGLSLDKAQELQVVETLKRFLDQRFEVALGSFEVAEILALLTTELAPLFYNKGVSDAHALLKDRVEMLDSELWALERH